MRPVQSGDPKSKEVTINPLAWIEYTNDVLSLLYTHFVHFVRDHISFTSYLQSENNDIIIITLKEFSSFVYYVDGYLRPPCSFIVAYYLFMRHYT